MKKCARCNKKITFLESFFRLDEDYCDKCVMEINVEIRERITLPIIDKNSHKAFASLAQDNKKSPLINQSKTVKK